MKILTNYDFNGNQLLNVVLQVLAADPTTPKEGQFYYNSANKKIYYYDGTAWKYMGVMTADEIVALINASTAVIDIENLPTSVGTAVTNSHTHANKTILDAIEVAFTTALLTKLNGIETGAQVNTITSVAGKTGAVSLAKSDVGLGNVTNDAQIKKLASSTNGYLPVWNGTTGDALAAGYAVETSLVGSASAIPRADAVKAYVDALLGASDAMIFKGTLGTGGTITAIPTTYNTGWSYKIITSGTYAGYVCEVGDLIVAIVDRAGSGNVDADWIVLQTNTDGVVIGPASATNGNFPVFSGTTGKLLGSSAYGPASFSAAGHNHDGTYTKKYSANIGGSTSVVVTHNLNTQDVNVTIRETASPYALVMTDIEFTSVNTLTVKFATAPTAGQYRITVVG